MTLIVSFHQGSLIFIFFPILYINFLKFSYFFSKFFRNFFPYFLEFFENVSQHFLEFFSQQK